jgi:hypothetical protein
MLVQGSNADEVSEPSNYEIYLVLGVYTRGTTDCAVRRHMPVTSGCGHVSGGAKGAPFSFSGQQSNHQCRKQRS